MKVSTQSSRFSPTSYSLAILRRGKKIKNYLEQCVREYGISRFVALLTVSVPCVVYQELLYISMDLCWKQPQRFVSLDQGVWDFCLKC